MATRAEARPAGVGGTPEEVVAQVQAAEARRRLRFRAIFVATWAVAIGGFIFALVTARRFDPAFLATWGAFILGGVPLTIFVSICSIVLASFLAVFGALGRLSHRAVPNALASLYVSLIRGTPLLVQILFFYLALPQVFPEAARIPIVAIGILALGFNYGAYMTEIFRAGIQAVPVGQREAAQALGMTERRILSRIVLPQAIRIVIPAIGNEFIAMMKDSALLSVIGIQELLWRAQTAGTREFRSLETLLLAAFVYWILTIVFSLFQDRLERRMARSDR